MSKLSEIESRVRAAGLSADEQSEIIRQTFGERIIATTEVHPRFQKQYRNHLGNHTQYNEDRQEMTSLQHQGSVPTWLHFLVSWG